jgi:hypothetical protein
LQKDLEEKDFQLLPNVWISNTPDDTDIIVLHRFFHTHADKIGKELLSMRKSSGEKAAIGKRAWDELCALLVDLGPPLEAPKLTGLKSNTHQDYMELMLRNADRDTSTVSHLFSAAPVSEVSGKPCLITHIC